MKNIWDSLKQKYQGTTKDENIGNLRIYQKYIGGYSGKKISIDLKLLKTHGNARKTS